VRIVKFGSKIITWQFVTETDGKIVLLFGNNMTAKEKAFEEGKKENK
jgi:hypothetical protein